MARVVRPGGTVAAYSWDMPGGGFPFQPIVSELQAMGYNPAWPPRPEASELETMRSLWIGAGLEAVEAREIAVRRSFADFDAVWDNCQANGNSRAVFSLMTAERIEELRERLRARMPAPDASGRIVLTARANAAKGRVPA